MFELTLINLCIDSSTLISSIRSYTNYFNGKENINNCFFYRINTFTASGGVINQNQGTYQLLISFCTFYNCSSSLYGGAIYIESTSSTFQIYSSCANSCQAPASGQFFWVTLSSTLINSINFSSIIKCSPNEPGTGHNSIRMDYGYQFFIESNSSNNKVNLYSSSLGIISPNFFLCKFSIINQNKATTSTILQLNGGNNLRSINFTNIISNITPSGSVFQVFSGTYYINDCIIYNNSKILFSGTNIVSNCFIDHDLNNLGITLSLLNYYTLTLLYNFKYFSTYYCLNNFKINLTKIKKIKNFFIIFLNLIILIL